MNIFKKRLRKKQPVIDESKWPLPPLDLLDSGQPVKPGKNTYGKVLSQIIEIVKKQGCDTETESVFAGVRTLDITLRPINGTTIKNVKRLSLAIGQHFDVPHVEVMLGDALNSRLIIKYPISEPRMVSLRQALDSKEFQNTTSPLSIPVGMENSGGFYMFDFAKSPNILIAGQKNSGKTNLITGALITSLVYRNTPDDLKIAIVAPRGTEYDLFYRLPHLLRPIINDPEECKITVQWLIEEMERRYDLLAQARARNIDQYRARNVGEMPYIVFILDELADLMMIDKKYFESNLIKLFQKSRAVGIHVVISTQRPIVEVISGLMKANIPARIAFQTASQIDSRVILDTTGAEKLGWQGDLILRDPGTHYCNLRLQAPLVTKDELEAVASYWDEQRSYQ